MKSTTDFKRTGPQVNIEIVAAIALVFVAASLGRLAYERRMDVLHGPYIEGRSHGADAARHRKAAVADR
jgi:hypothetical protein